MANGPRAERAATDAALSPALADRLGCQILVGRARELGLLLEAAIHPPALALVNGEAGVGKTRLVEELLASPKLQSRHRYLGCCQQLAEPFPLGPVLEALREAALTSTPLTPVVGVVRPLLPELAARLPEPPDPLGDKRAERHRRFRALRELLGALGSAVLVLEDLHWADEQTAEFLRFLVPQLPPNLTLVCTYRGEDLSESSPLRGLKARLPREIIGVELTLRPLAKAQVRELARSILETEDISEEFTDYLFAGSGGLPFAVEELLRLLADRKDLVRRRGLWVRRDLGEMGVPKVLQASILERLARLRVPARAVVRAAAVLGVPAEEQLLLEVAQPDTAADTALAEALSSALLLEVGEDLYDFRHVLARQAVDEAIPSPLRRRLHLRAARALEAARPKPLARLAGHYRVAGQTKEWIRYAEAAADRANSLEDDATAYGFLKEAVAVPRLSPRTRARLATKLAAHARYCFAHGEAIEILRRLLDEEPLARGARGELRMWLVRLLSLAGEHAAAYGEALQAVGELSRRPGHAADVMLFLAQPWGETGRVEEHLAWLDRAERMVARSNDRAVRISVAGLRAVFLLVVGDPRGWKAIEEIPRPGPTAREMERAWRMYGNLAEALLHLGYYRRAEEFNREALRLLKESGHHRQTYAPVTELQRLWLAGEWAGLEERARFYTEAYEDYPAARAGAGIVLGLLLLARGEVRAALGILEPLREDFRGETQMLAWLSGGLARIRLAEGRSEAAVEEAARALEVIEQKGVWAWATDVAPVAVEALLAADGRAEAVELTRRFANGLRGRDAPAASAALAACRARLAEGSREPERAAGRYLAAERSWQALSRPYQAAQAHEGAGRCLLRERPEQGRELLVEAMDRFRELGAGWDAARVRRTLRKHGLIPPHRAGRKSYGQELSPREAQIAQLAGDGLTNPEIAVALFVSRKTVERHLSSAMRKLDVKSRAGLSESLGAREPFGA